MDESIYKHALETMLKTVDDYIDLVEELKNPDIKDDYKEMVLKDIDDFSPYLRTMGFIYRELFGLNMNDITRREIPSSR